MGRVKPVSSTDGLPEKTNSDGQKVSKLLFPKPDTFTIAGKEPVMEQVTTMITAADGNGVLETNTRLKSARESSFKIFVPRFVKYEISEQPTIAQINDYCDQAEVEGFGTGAVVARRWSGWNSKIATPCWGVIMLTRRYKDGTDTPYSPFIVKWLNTNVAEGAWKEDLLVIHQCLSGDLLCDLLEAQGITVD